MITIEQCSCGDPICSVYTLVGIGMFYQGSGFTRDEAQRIADLLNREPPALDIDSKLYPNGKVHARGRLERRVVWNLIHHIEQAGFRIFEINDGEELTHPGDAVAAMETLFNVDEASLRFLHKDEKDTDNWYGVMLVFGNGVDCISDWNYDDADAAGFNAAMEAFDPESFA